MFVLEAMLISKLSGTKIRNIHGILWTLRTAWQTVASFPNQKIESWTFVEI
jgi:hypothetical protein